VIGETEDPQSVTARALSFVALCFITGRQLAVRSCYVTLITISAICPHLVQRKGSILHFRIRPHNTASHWQYLNRVEHRTSRRICKQFVDIRPLILLLMHFETKFPSFSFPLSVVHFRAPYDVFFLYFVCAFIYFSHLSVIHCLFGSFTKIFLFPL
jgi:hypothetical protein